MEATVRATTQEAAESQAIFLVWAAPTFGSGRSRSLAKELRMPAPIYLYSTVLKGPRTAPLRYVIHAAQTLLLLFKKRPQVVLVQSPPSFAALFVALYCAVTGSRYIIDAHSDAFQRGFWYRPAWLHDWVTRNAAAVLITDEFFRQRIERIGGKVLILRELAAAPQVIPVSSATPVASTETFTVTVVNTFSTDEPLQEVLRAAANLPDMRFMITGKRSRAEPGLIENAPANVTFTDFLPRDEYDWLLSSSSAVISLTTRDHTYQCGASEALAAERPVITSDWPLLREYFNRGTVHVDNTSEGIRRGIEEVQRNHSRYEKEIADLHAIRRSEWQQCTAELASLIYRKQP